MHRVEEISLLKGEVEALAAERDRLVNLDAAIRIAFALREGESPIAFIREVGDRMRRLEDALDSDLYPCPECGHGQIRATVLDALVGAVYVEGSCCLDADERVVAAALERDRLAQVLGG